MPRKIIVKTIGELPLILSEVIAADEYELQELIKANPDLLPIEEYEMTRPLLVVGRETTLASGAVDLVALARSGQLLIVEFKTGPQNTDFRKSFAQLIDYGSDLWSLSFEEFESTVPVRYFADHRYCEDARVRNKKSILEAARETWPDFSDEEMLLLRDRLTSQLKSGSFHYVLVAQRFSSTVDRTVEYLNHRMSDARFYAVELVKFSTEKREAFEARTILKPAPRRATSGQIVDQVTLLDRLANGGFRECIERLLERCSALGYRFEWGTAGVSIRLPTPDRAEPITVAWVFPPDGSGWMSLRNLTLGYGNWIYKDTESSRGPLDNYLSGLQSLRSEGVEPAKVKGLLDTAFSFSPSAAVRHESAITELLATLIGKTADSSLSPSAP